MRVMLDVPISLRELVSAVKSTSENLSDGYISALCTDTREAEMHDLFIALNGENGSGETFVSEALNKGCYVLSSAKIPQVITVNDTADALLNLAEFYKKRLRLRCTVAVTGSVGKSTTVKFLSKILSEEYKVHSTIGNFNNHIGVPLTILSAPKETEIMILELGMNHTGEISRLSKCARPDIAIITSIGTSHIGNLGSRENIARAKLEITDGMNGGKLILPKNEPLLLGVDNALYVSRSSSLSHFYFHNTGNTYSLSSPYGAIEGISFFDKRDHLLDDLALAISASQAVGMSADSIIKGVAAINEGDLRQRFIEKSDFTILDDSYNASLESVVTDLEYISTLKRPTGAFLGDVLELGEKSEKIHEAIGLEAARLNIGHLYLIGAYAEYIKKGAIRGGMSEDAIYVNTTASPDASVNQIIKKHFPREIILFKASHRMRLDKIADIIKEIPNDNDR